ncbi:3'-5'-exoribonuclease [Bonamia ostreae]|uniref:3'-5'-exoribonuclease n=1 Tax=Bonamia ostreae TaxID=126728 RepID=A0ABV2AJM4_9EUKA
MDNSEGPKNDFVVQENETVPPQIANFYVEHLGSKILTKIKGPHHAKIPLNKDRGTLELSVKLTDFCTKGRHILKPETKETEEQKITNFVRKAIDPIIDYDSFPDTVLSIEITIIDLTENAIPATIFGLVLGLCRANIGITDIVGASTVLLIGEELIYALGNSSEALAKGRITICFAANMRKITHIELEGPMSQQKIGRAIEMAIKRCYETCSVLATRVKSDFTN